MTRIRNLITLKTQGLYVHQPISGKLVSVRFPQEFTGGFQLSEAAHSFDVVPYKTTSQRLFAERSFPYISAATRHNNIVSTTQQGFTFTVLYYAVNTRPTACKFTSGC